MGSTISGAGGSSGGNYPIDNQDDDKGAKGLRQQGGVEDTKDTDKTDDAKAAEDAAAAQAAAAAAAAQAAQNARNADGVDKSGGTNNNSGVDGIGAPGDGNQPVKHDSISDLPHGDASEMGAAIIGEIEQMYANQEANLEMEAQKQINDQKGRIEDLERKIGEMKEQIKNLQRAAEKIVYVAEKMAKIIDQLAPYLQHEPSPFARLFGMEDMEKASKQAQLNEVLKAILKDAGIELDPLFLNALTSGMMTQGQAGPMMAFYIASKVADLMFEKEHPDAAKAARDAQEATPTSDPAAAKDAKDAKDAKPDPTKVDATAGAKDTDPAKAATTPDGLPTNPEDMGKNLVDDKDRDQKIVDAETPDWVGGDAAAFKDQLEALAVNAAIYGGTEPGTLGYEFQEDGSYKVVDIHANAEAAMIEAMFPGMGKGPNNYQVTKDFADAKRDGIRIQGFTISSQDFARCASMSGPQVGEYLKTLINQQATAMLKDIDKAIAKLNKEIEVAKGEIVKAYAEIDKIKKKLEEDKKKLGESKEKALAQAKKTIEQLVKTEMEAQKKLLEELNKFVVEQLNSCMETIESEGSTNKPTTPQLLR